MLNEIAIRRSARIFSKKSVENEKLVEILSAGRWAPSCFNNQPWHFVVLKGEQTNKIHNALNRGNYWAKNADIIIAVVSKSDLDCLSDGREYYMFDAGLAVENMLLESYHQGLVAHSILGFNEKMVKQALDIPDEFRVITLVIIGYQGNFDEADEVLKSKEQEPRTRKSLDEIVHWGGW